MKKKLAILAAGCALVIIISGFQSTMLYGTDYMEVRAGYTFSVSATIDWWDCNWSYCKEIRIDHTKVQNNLTNFPVLLFEPTDSDLVAHAQSNGNDIAFVHRYNSTQFKHEIEKFDSSTGELWTWVNVTRISSTEDTIFYMYYGNPTCGNQEDASGTWGPNYIMVQHLDESAGTIFDSTSFNNDGTNDGATYNSNSKIQGGYDFDGNDNITCSNDSSLNITGAITIEGWVKDPPWLKYNTKTEVKIVDKRDEKRRINPVEEFIVERTISTNKEIELTFAALFSTGIKIKDIILKDESILDSIYIANHPISKHEKYIEEIREKLPDKLKKLQLIAYSKPFTIDKEQTIKMIFETELNKLSKDSRISYLLLSSDGAYDYESSTYLTYSLGTNDSIDPFFNFYKFIGLLNRQNSKDYALDNQISENPATVEQNNDEINQVVKQTMNIVIKSSEHLDEDKKYISDVYSEVYQLDNIWSEIVPSGHYLRVAFEHPLDNTRDITLYIKTISGTPRIEVYESYGNEIIAEFQHPTSNNYNKIYLTDLNGNQDTFDLLVLDGDIEIDYIVDPGSFNDATIVSAQDDDGDASFTISNVNVPTDVTNAILIVVAACEESTEGAIPLPSAVQWGSGGSQDDLVKVEDHYVEDSGNSYSCTVAMWMLSRPDPGTTKDVIITYDQAADRISGSAFVIEGVADANAEATAENSDEDTSPTNTIITTVSKNAYIIDAFVSGSTQELSVSQGATGQLEHIDFDGNSHCHGVSDKQGPSTPGGTTLGWNCAGNSRQAHIVAAFAKEVEPYITMNSPSNGSGEISPVTLNVTVNNSEGENMGIKFYGDGNLINWTNTTGNQTVTYDWSPINGGIHTWNVSVNTTITTNESDVRWFAINYFNDTFDNTIYNGKTLISTFTNITHDGDSNWTLDEYNQTINDMSPDFRWMLDGDETDCVDGADSDGGNDPTWVSSIIPYSDAIQCGDYDGSSDETLIPNQALINTVTTYEKSISVWIEADTIDTTGNGRPIWLEGGGTNGLALYVLNEGGEDRLYACVYETTNIDYCYTTISTGTLYHVGLTLDCNAGELILYLNGTQVASDTTLAIGSGFAAHQAGICIGQIDIGGQNHNDVDITGFFDGRIEDVTYWGEQNVLTQSNFSIIYSRGISSEGNITSVNITKPSTAYWDKFYADTSLNGANSTFSILDNTTNDVILSNLNGDGEDISSLKNDSIILFGEFNASLTFKSWNVSWKFAPTQSGESPTNTSTNVDVCPVPILHVYCSDKDPGDSMTATWRSNSSGPWVDFAVNNSISNPENITQTSTNFSNYSTTYYWSVNLTDGQFWTNETYHFTTQPMTTSVNTIIPYNITTKPLTITAEGDSCLDNVTMWYRYSPDNSSWGTNVSWNHASNPDDAHPWSWEFNFKNGTGYYEFYSIGKKFGSSDESFPVTPDAICNYSVSAPTIYTNISTGIEETNATLRGYLFSNGSFDATCGFRFGTTSGSYSENFTKGIYPSRTEFENNNESLSIAQIYFYQAWAYNINGFVNGSEISFLTKPNPPTNLNAQTNSTSVIYLTWNIGTGYNTTYIERNASGDTVWERGAGTMVYNGSGTNYEDTGLLEGVTYYYQAWSFANWTYDSTTIHQWSDNNDSDNSTTKSRPTQSGESPVNQSTNIGIIPILYVICSDPNTADTLNATWWSNSTGSWVQFGVKNASFSSGTNITQTNSNFSDYNTKYWWSVNLTDGEGGWNNETYFFTTEIMSTSVNTITPYNISTKQLNITATGPTDLDNVTLYYRWSPDNITWDSYSPLIKRIQTGEISLTGDDTFDLTYKVNQSASFLTGTFRGGGNTPNSAHVRLYWVDSDTIGFDAEDVTQKYVRWWVVEFNESANVHVEHINETLNAGVVNTDLSQAVNQTESWIIYNGLVVAGATWGNDDHASVVFLDDDTITWTISSAANQVVSAEVVWLPDSFVEHHEVNGWSTATNDLALTHSFDNNRTILFSSSDDGGNLDPQSYAWWGNLTTPTNIRMTRTGTVAIDTISIFVVELPYTANVQREIVQFSTSETQKSLPITNVNTSNSFIIGFGGGFGDITTSGGLSTENDDDTTTSTATLQFNSSTEVGLERTDTGGDSFVLDMYVTVIEFTERNWNKWNHDSNPDNGYPWSWDFNFPNGTGYYEFYSIGNKSGSANETTPSSADARCRFIGTEPKVTTNESTGVEETNATLCGWLKNDGTIATECGFWLDTVPGGTSNNYSVGTISNNTEFRYNAQGLTPGQLYYFKAWANNSAGFNSTANEVTFLTKPNVTSSLNVQANSSSIIYLTWTAGDGANTTYIERNTIANWARGTGTEVYNGSGTNYEDTGLTNSTNYYYQAWSYANWTNPNLFHFSDLNLSGSITTKNKPEITNIYPANDSAGIPLNPTPSLQLNHSDGYQMNITWYWGTDNSTTNMFGKNSSVTNGTYEMANSNFTTNAVTYYWRVTINDGHGEWTNETYHFTTIAGNKIVLSKSSNAYSLEISPSGTTLYGYINDNSVSAFIDTEWHYVSLTYNGANIRLYKDGELVDTSGYIGSINKNGNDLTIGSWLTGTLDEIRISNTSRSPAWINTTYQNTNSPTTFATFSSEIGILKTWTYRKKIWINASLIENDLPYFPVLISTTDTDLKNNALSNGNDIIFTNSSVDWTTSSYTDRLPHEVELYDDSTGELIAWVNVTSLSSTTNTSIYMYYGNTLCPYNRENATGVWDSNYVMVQHLNEASGIHYDSTQYENNGTASVTTQGSAIGKIDGADSLDGNSNYVEVNTSNWDASNGTIEIWGKATGFSINHNYFFGHTTIPAYNNRIQLYTDDVAGNLDLGLGDSHSLATDIKDLDTNIWYHIALTWNGSDYVVLVDGVSEATGQYTGLSTISTYADIGNDGNSDARNEAFNGIIDEVRISNIARNSSWINTTYNCCNNTINFAEFGRQEIQNVAPILSSPSPNNGAIGVSLKPSLFINVNDTNVDAMNVTFYTNATGSWGLIGYYDSVYNGTYSQTNDSMNNYNTKYWWSVNVTDYKTWKNNTYSFTTSVLPEITGEKPANNSVGISIWPACNVTVSDTDGGTVDVYFYENTTGPWILQQTNGSVDISSPVNVIWSNFTNASQPSTKYNWSVHIFDGAGWANKTYYFTTAASPFLYIYNNNKFTKLSDFLPRATSSNKEYKQFIDVTDKLEVINGKVWLKITEELDETTYLDHIYLRVDESQIIALSNMKWAKPIIEQSTAHIIPLQKNKQLLKFSDNNYLEMKKGDQYLIEFYITNNYYKIEFVSEGYFIKN